MKWNTGIFMIVLAAGLMSDTAPAAERYYYLPLRHLEITGAWPDTGEASENLNWLNRTYLKYYLPYAVGSSGEEIYIDFIHNEGDRPGSFNLWRIGSVTQLLNCSFIAIKADSDVPPAGTLYLPKADLSGMVTLTFTLPKETAESGGDGERQFYTAMKNHYDFLRTNGFSGAPWFRYRADQARRMLEKGTLADANDLQADQPFAGRRDAFDDGISLFTGTRAISENIQLDRTLRTRLHEPRTIDIATVQGITTAQIDWKAAVKDVKVEKDPLARYIPADQHAIFYPTFKSMVTVMDELKAGKAIGLPIAPAVDNVAFYEQQMCVWLDGWSRFWGPKTIRNVAITGSDPYGQTGTDSAVLFDARLTSSVRSNTESKQKKSLKEIEGAKMVTGTVGGVSYQAVVSPDRAVSSYLATIDHVVVVTNSLPQLEKIVRTAKSGGPSIADLDEYTYFRHRYPLDEKGQTAFLVLSDAAIRRWCDPFWRIGSARRAMAAAVLQQLQAEYLDKGPRFDLSEAQKTAANWVPDIGTLSLTRAGVTSSVYGNLKFMTPIIELPISKISEQEDNAYRRFRQMYQRQWQLFFDPIAVSLLLTDDRIDVDLTVRPLIAATAYRQYIQIAGSNAIEAGDGDVHPESLLQLILAIDTGSDVLRQTGGFAMQMMNQDINALSWLGSWITVYADDDPFWTAFAERLKDRSASGFSEYLESNLNRVPLALAMEVDNPAKLTLFLVSLRAFIQQTAPDMTAWETLSHNERSYVKVTARYRPDAGSSPAVYYAILPDSLVVSFHEGLIQRAIDRGSLRADNKETGGRHVWLGKNLSARASEKAWPVIEMLAHENYGRYLQMQSWDHLPILTEWHNRGGDVSESAFHQQYWHTDLTCPGGGGYVWSEEFRTMRSAVFGHPGRPERPGETPTPLTRMKDVQMGITFEEDGLRAKTVIERKD
jgi:hypothetical protein